MSSPFPPSSDPSTPKSPLLGAASSSPSSPFTSNTLISYQTMDSSLASSSSSSSSPLFHSSQFTSNNSPCLLTLTPTHVILNKNDSILIDDIIGCHRDVSTGILTLHVYHQPISFVSASSATPKDFDLSTVIIPDGKSRRYRPVVISTSSLTDSLSFHSLLHRLLLHVPLSSLSSPSFPLPRRFLLIFVNPASGSGAALARYKEVESMIKQSEIPYEMILTSCQYDAFDRVKKMDFSLYDDYNISCSSGDGLVHEVVNGIFQRSDWKSLLSKITIGTIGGGSGNGLAKSITNTSGESFSSINAAYLIVKGWSRPMDLFSTYQMDNDANVEVSNNNENHSDGNSKSENSSTSLNASASSSPPTSSSSSSSPSPPSNPMNISPIRFGFLSLSWAFISDVDLNSETFRCCGGARFTFSALYTLCCSLNRYKGEIEILRPKGSSHDERKGEEKGPHSLMRMDHVTPCMPSAQCPQCISNKDVKTQTQRNEKEQEKDDSSAAAVVETKSLEEYLSLVTPSPSSPPSSSPSSLFSSESWESIPSSFTAIWLMNLPWAATDSFPAPSAHFSDGECDVVLIRDIGKTRMLQWMLSLEEGRHTEVKQSEYVKCKGFRLRSKDHRECVMAIDGERLRGREVEVRCWKGIIKCTGK